MNGEPTMEGEGQVFQREGFFSGAQWAGLANWRNVEGLLSLEGGGAVFSGTGRDFCDSPRERGVSDSKVGK